MTPEVSYGSEEVLRSLDRNNRAAFVKDIVVYDGTGIFLKYILFFILYIKNGYVFLNYKISDFTLFVFVIHSYTPIDSATLKTKTINFRTIMLLVRIVIMR